MLKINTYKPEEVFFTSDPHFLHNNIIKFAKRPFKNSHEMNEILIRNWNNKIPEESHVFLLGDFIFTGNTGIISEYANRLNGKIHIILGNHDHKNKLYRDIFKTIFEEVCDYREIYVDDKENNILRRIVLFHYPLLTWNHKLYGSWQLFGHIHSSPNKTASEGELHTPLLQYDVGVDNNKYIPLSYYDIKEIFKNKQLN